ncbi:MAG TPA: coproporphyrinogen-III oxidase family protein [Phycisphaerales bacterium]|nr:coproporphyrinogen-III oxidase family protein [Phycisphaerales bacterium]
MAQETVNVTVGGSGRRSVRAAAALPEPDQARPVRSLYIHTPFCSHKCHYCDFYSFVDDGTWGKDVQGAFVERLIGELRALAPWARGAPLRTVFVGGGTPSLLRIELWERLLRVLGEEFDLSLIRGAGGVNVAVTAELAIGGRVGAGDAAGGDGQSPPAAAPLRARAYDRALPEFTVECNPESASAALMSVLRAGGVTRVSMGAQSFVARHLETLERTHNPENVARGIENARRAGIGRQSVDLIYAIPGQTTTEWEDDLAGALALGTTHLSCYNLTYEPQTQMTARLRRGEFAPVDEETEAEMFEAATRLLEARGLRRYEVSNYAVPGMESRHNLAYWLQEDWLAAGPSASGHVRGVRTKNVGNLRMYLEGEGTSLLSEAEPVDPVRAVRERLMTGVRLARGVDAAEMVAAAESVAPGAGERLARVAEELKGDGLLAPDAERWRVDGERGWLLADWIAKRLMAAVGERPLTASDK